ncbi:hypothetical protein [Sulfuricurvum sp.]|uniref:hypothetical protein n=1 Tax=Sulfuricurvum sp. TaxID=2025608 RepID=UPI003BB7474C
MIKLLWLLCAVISLFAKETVFFIPNNHASFVHELSKAFKNSSQVFIVTSSFNHTELQKRLTALSKQETNITIILNNAKSDPLSMVQYHHINLYYSTIPLDQTFILIDHSYGCILDGGIEDEAFHRQHTPIRCSTDPIWIKTLYTSLSPIMKYSKRYLK